MTDFEAFDAKIASPALRAVAEHWNDARKGQKMPSWSQLRPSTLAPHLGLVWAFKYDRSRGEFTARLAGNRMMVASGKSLRGTPLQQLHAPAIFQWVHEGLTRVVSEPACYRSRGQLFKVGGRMVEGERVVLPLGTDENGADGALGASDYDFTFTTSYPDIEVFRGDGEWLTL